jgi:hypothetical protein
MLERPQAEFVVYRTVSGELDWMHESVWLQVITDTKAKHLKSEHVLTTTSINDAINFVLLANKQLELENT